MNNWPIIHPKWMFSWLPPRMAVGPDVNLSGSALPMSFGDEALKDLGFVGGRPVPAWKVVGSLT